jgi:N-acetylglucosamine kinase-like BadF-type ATPase
VIALTWKRRLDSAMSAGEVLVLAREFLATLSAVDLERLPAFWRPGELASSDDVRSYAHRLSRHFIDGDAAAARLLTRLVQFFSSAAVRLTEIEESRVPVDKP